MAKKLKPDACYVTVKLDRELIQRIERFADDEFCNRCDAVRTLLERGLRQ